MPRQRYIRATGSACYDETGITFPVKEAISFDHILEGLKDPRPRWENEFGWQNQPKVLLFSASDEEARLVDERLDAHPAAHGRLLVLLKDWRTKVS